MSDGAGGGGKQVRELNWLVQGNPVSDKDNENAAVAL